MARHFAIFIDFINTLVDPD